MNIAAEVTNRGNSAFVLQFIHGACLVRLPRCTGHAIRQISLYGDRTACCPDSLPIKETPNEARISSKKHLTAQGRICESRLSATLSIGSPTSKAEQANPTLWHRSCGFSSAHLSDWSTLSLLFWKGLAMFRSTISTRQARPKVRLRVESLENRVTPSRTITVDDDAHQFHHPDFTTIQAAVDAAHSGDHILVAAGNYHEQVVIPAGKNGLDIHGLGDARITAPTTFGDPSDAIVHDAGATGLKLWGFTIQGNGGTTGPDVGVLVDGGGSAEVRSNRILNIRDNPLSGNQTGVAIQFGELTTGGSGSGSAVANWIDGYQKGGIVVIGDGSNADLRFNTVRGAGATNAIAQNGIQVSDGAQARVEFNTVSGNKYTGQDFEGVGILVFNTSHVRIKGNTAFNNDEGILLFGDTGSTVSDVTVELNTSNHNTFNGIGLSNVSFSTVRLNTTNSNGSDGINVELSTGNEIKNNWAYFNHRDGIALESTATVNFVHNNAMVGNTMFDAFDASTGSGTGGTANLWEHNHFHTSSPSGLH
jgi:parallel beta-helix repeat protein